MVSVGELAGLGIAIVVVALVIGIGSEIMMQFRETATTKPTDRGLPNQSSETYFWNVTSKGLTSINTFGVWLPLVSLVVVASVIIGLVVNYMGRVA